MGYEGRIILLLFSMLMSLSVIFFHIFKNIDTMMYDVLGFVFWIPIFWWLGKQYDRSKYYQMQLKEKEEEVEEIFNNVNAYVFSIDMKTNKAKVSLGAERLYGYSQDDFNRNPSLWLEAIHEEDVGKIEENLRGNAWKNGETFHHEHRIVRSDGQIIWVDGYITPILNANSEIIRLNIFLFNITERKMVEEQNQYLANHDTLTGLPNQYMFNKCFEKALFQGKQRSESFAILYIDMDRFKHVNDTMGHWAGDILLKDVANRLESCVDTGGDGVTPWW